MMNLTQEEKNKKIAEACGLDEWVIVKSGYYYRPEAAGYTSSLAEAWKLPKAQAQKYEYPHDEPVTIKQAATPNYFSDLNACHEAEKVLTDSQSDRYVALLVGLILKPKRGLAHYAIHTAAAPRAEALGQVLKLWEAGE